MSCVKSRKEKKWEETVTDFISKWEGQTIVLGDSLQWVKGKDEYANYYNNSNNGFKLITYIDGDCGVCMQELIFWLEFIQKLKENEVEINFMPFIHGIKKEIIVDKLKRLEIGYYWIYADDDCYVKRYNFRPKLFHTFLLNTENKIILIGNPVLNPALKDLYIKTIIQSYHETNF